ncbi:MAG: tetratricopeptide repeat protein [Isosphaeraceae bacterium]
MSGTQGGQSEDPPVSPSPPGRARRRSRLTLALAVAAIAAIVLGGLWSVNTWDQMSAANDHYNLGVDLQEQGKMSEAVAEYGTAIRLKPDFAEAHTNLGIALKAQGELEEAVAEFRKARDNAPPGSHFAQSIERELTGTED